MQAIGNGAWHRWRSRERGRPARKVAHLDEVDVPGDALEGERPERRAADAGCEQALAEPPVGLLPHSGAAPALHAPKPGALGRDARRAVHDLAMVRHAPGQRRNVRLHLAHVDADLWRRVNSDRWGELCERERESCLESAEELPRSCLEAAQNLPRICPEAAQKLLTLMRGPRKTTRRSGADPAVASSAGSFRSTSAHSSCLSSSSSHCRCFMTAMKPAPHATASSGCWNAAMQSPALVVRQLCVSCASVVAMFRQFLSVVEVRC
jgi:hypothetical protein